MKNIIDKITWNKNLETIRTFIKTPDIKITEYNIVKINTWDIIVFNDIENNNWIFKKIKKLLNIKSWKIIYTIYNKKWYKEGIYGDTYDGFIAKHGEHIIALWYIK